MLLQCITILIMLSCMKTFIFDLFNIHRLSCQIKLATLAQNRRGVWKHYGGGELGVICEPISGWNAKIKICFTNQTRYVLTKPN